MAWVCLCIPLREEDARALDEEDYYELAQCGKCEEEYKKLREEKDG